MRGRRVGTTTAKLLVLGAFIILGAGSVVRTASSTCNTCGCDDLIFSPEYHGTVCSGGYTGKQCSLNGIHTCSIFQED